MHSTSAVPNRSGAATTSSTGTPSTVRPTTRRSSADSSATICGSSTKRVNTGRGSAAAHTTARCSQSSRQRRGSPAIGPAECVRDRADEFAGAVDQQPLPRPRLLRAGERFEQARLRARPDAARGLQAAGERRVAELARRPHVERTGDLQRPLRGQSEVAAEPDEVRRELALELGQLGDRARLDELAQLRLDARPDPAQLPDPPRAHEVRDRRRRAPDRLGGAPVRAGAVRVRLGELQQPRERLEPVGDPRVVHGPIFQAPMKPETWAIVGGRPERVPGAPLNTPLVPASNFVLGTERLYSRTEATETWEAFEEVLGGLEGGHAVSFSSGMAACNAVLSQLPTGAHLVIPDDCYQGVAGIAEAGARDHAWQVERVPAPDTETWIAKLLEADLVWLESPTNPLLDVADVAAICAAPRKDGVRVVVDNTFATPLLQQPLSLGADVVVHAATKFLGGHSDLLMGAAVAKERRSVSC